VLITHLGLCTVQNHFLSLSFGHGLDMLGFGFDLKRMVLSKISKSTAKESEENATNWPGVLCKELLIAAEFIIYF